MKIVFVSNYFNHHQKPFCEEMYQKLGNDFYFIATQEMRIERIKLGYAKNDAPTYLRTMYENEGARQEALRIINEADAVMIGAAPEACIMERVRKGKLVLRYSERPFKIEPSFWRRLYYAIWFRRRDRKNKNVYMLCASAYAAKDFDSIGMYGNHMYKWGYFPAVNAYDVDMLLSRKKHNTILWCGRFIDWKHPDDAIKVAWKLKECGCEFQLNMIGIGDMEEKLQQMAKDLDVTDVVHFLGSMSPERVRMYMEEAGIYLFTSDRQEGWGAVLNEAMASCCAVVASDAAGSTPFLVEDGNNGIVYQSGNIDDLFAKVQHLLRNPLNQKQQGKQAYRTIAMTWNSGVASERLLKLVERLLEEEKPVRIYEDGPCSYASIE